MKYLVIGNIKRDGKALKRNSTVELDDDAEAAELVRGGFLAVKPADAAKPAEKGGKKDGEDK